MKLLILGESSQLGRELCALLSRLQIEYSALASDELDLLKRMDVVKVLTAIEPTQVLNVPAYANLELMEGDPEIAKASDILNTQGLSILAEVCDHLNLPLIQHSSSYVFDGLKPQPYTEEDSTNPVSRFGLSQWYAERAIRDGLDRHIILRTDWLFSSDNSDYFEACIENCKSLQGKLNIMTNRFSPTPASDAARVLVGIAQQIDCGAEVWGSYHYCALQAVNQEQFIEYLLREASQYDATLAEAVEQLSIHLIDVEVPYILNSSLDCEKIKETFGIMQHPRVEHVNQVLSNLYQSR